MALRSASAPRKRLLAHLTQAVETLSLRNEQRTVAVPLEGIVEGNVELQFFEVTKRELDHFENISQALARLDQGTYGRCVFCGSRIEEVVLARAPWANECLNCQGQDSRA